jgi:hypothetical protein
LDEAGDLHLLCSRKDGMGARVSNLLWTWRLARKIGARTLCYWPPLDSYYGAATGVAELFDVGRIAATGLRHELAIVDARPSDHFSPRLIPLIPGEPVDPRLYAVSSARIEAGRDLPVMDTAIGPLLAPGESAEQALAEVRQLFARLPLRGNLRLGIKHARRNAGLASMVAVHVRRGDIVEVLRHECAHFSPASLEPGSLLDRYTEHFFRGCAPTAAYLRLIRPYLKQGFRIAFFSDTPGAAAPFTKRFGDKMILGDSLAPAGLSGLQEALFEMAVMSRCHAIIGAKSQFSTLASMIGDTALVDARRHVTGEEFLLAYRQATDFDRLEPVAQAGVAEVLLRHLERINAMENWGLVRQDVLRLMDLRVPA